MFVEYAILQSQICIWSDSVLNPVDIQIPSAVAEVMLSISLKIKSSSVHDRNTRARTSVVRTALSGLETCSSQRQSNRQKLLTNQSTTSRERLQGAGFNVDKNESLFLSQDENEPMDMGTETHFEHDGNFDGFESKDFETERFDSIESQVVVFASTGRTEVSSFRFTKTSTIWVSKPRRSRVAERIVNVFSKKVWKELTSLIYKRKYQTFLDENEKRMLRTVLIEKIRQEKMYETLTKTSLPDIQMRNVESNDENEK